MLSFFRTVFDWKYKNRQLFACISGGFLHFTIENVYWSQIWSPWKRILGLQTALSHRSRSRRAWKIETKYSDDSFRMNNPLLLCLKNLGNRIVFSAVKNSASCGKESMLANPGSRLRHLDRSSPGRLRQIISAWLCFCGTGYSLHVCSCKVPNFWILCLIKAGFHSFLSNFSMITEFTFSF